MSEPNPPPFRAGDLVFLKSGSPWLTVETVTFNADNDIWLVRLVWIDHSTGQMQHDVVASEALEAVNGSRH